jgi:hypothetical protein
MFGFYIEILNIVHLSSLDLVKSAPKQEGIVGILGSLLNKVFLHQVRSNKILKTND